MARNKGIVMEYNDGQAIILTPQGNFERIKSKKPLEVGDYYFGNSAAMQKRYAMIAVLLLALTLGTWDFFAVKAYAQVSSSLELGVNRWNRVVTVRPLDAKGATILQESNFTGQKVEEAVEAIADKSLNNASLEPKSPAADFPMSARPKDERDVELKQNVEQEMNKGLQNAIKKRNCQADVNNGKSKINNSNPNSNRDTNSNNNANINRDINSNNEKIKEPPKDNPKGVENDNKSEKVNKGPNKVENNGRDKGDNPSKSSKSDNPHKSGDL